MNCFIPYNRFFQANFSKAKILVDFFVNKTKKQEYDEYIRQGIEDLIQTLNTERYGNFLFNIDQVLNSISVNDNDFTSISIMVLSLITFLLSEGKTFLSGEYKYKFCYETEYLNNCKTECRVYMSDLYERYIGDFSSPTRCKNKHMIVAPFICPSGAFGYNTFLYLYFNNIAPIGFSTNLNPKLHVAIGTSFEASNHDIRHYGYRYCMIPLDVQEKYRRIYYEILEDYNMLTQESQLLRRKYLFFLFFLINEIAFGYIDLKYKYLKREIRLRFSCPKFQPDLMSRDEYRLAYLVDSEDLVPVLVEDLHISYIENPYDITSMNDYVIGSLLDLADIFQDRFGIFT